MMSSAALTYIVRYFFENFSWTTNGYIMKFGLMEPSLTKPKKKPPGNFCSISFENEGVEFITIARILRNPEIGSQRSNIRSHHQLNITSN